MCLITCDMYGELPSMPARQKTSCYGRRTRARSRWLGLIELKLGGQNASGGREIGKKKRENKRRLEQRGRAIQSEGFFFFSFIRFSKKKKSSWAVKVEARQ